MKIYHMPVDSFKRLALEDKHTSMWYMIDDTAEVCVVYRSSESTQKGMANASRYHGEWALGVHLGK